MRKLIIATVLLLAGLAVVQPVGAASPSIGALPGEVHVASGRSAVTNPEGETRTFSFTAVQFPSGQVFGHANLRTFGGVRLGFALRCMRVSGNRAVIGGVVTRASVPEAVGTPAVFAVQDEPDHVSLLLTPDEELPVVDCDTIMASDLLGFAALPATVFLR